jgi:hypothetical protein
MRREKGKDNIVQILYGHGINIVEILYGHGGMEGRIVVYKSCTDVGVN